MTRVARAPHPLEAAPAGDFMPAASEAEKIVLGVIFTEVTAGLADAPSLRAATAEGIGPRHFESAARRAIFQASRSPTNSARCRARKTARSASRL